MTEEKSSQRARLEREKALRRLQKAESNTAAGQDEAATGIEDYFRSMVENTPDVILIVEKDGTITYVNPASQGLLGFEEKELQDRKLFDFIHPDDLPLLNEYLSNVITEPDFGPTTEIRFHHKYERWLYLEAAGRAFKRGLLPKVIILSLRDVTSRKEAEALMAQRENYYRSLVVNSSDMISILDEDLIIRWASAAVGYVTGYKPADAFGKSLSDFIHPDDWDGFKAFIAKEIAEPDAFANKELRFRHKDGTYHYHDGVFVNRLRDPAVKGFVVNSRDVTEQKTRDEDLKRHREHLDEMVLERAGDLEEVNRQLRWEIAERKRAEEQLKRSEAYYRDFLDNIMDMVFLLNEDLTIRFVGPSVQMMLGYNVEELIDESVFDFLHPEDIVVALEAMRESLESPGKRLYLELRARHRDGTWHYLECIGRNLLNDPIMRGFVVSARDTTERNTAEESLRESEERYRTLVDEMNDIVSSWDPHGVIDFVAPSISSHLQYTPEELVGKCIRDFLHPDDIMVLKQRTERIAAGEIVEPYEYRILDKDGSIKYMNISTRALRRDGQITKYISVLSDVNEKKRAEQALTESESKYRNLFGVVTDAILIVEENGLRIVDCNPAALEMFGYAEDEIKDLAILDLLPAEAREGALEKKDALRQNEQLVLEAMHLRKDGSQFPAEVAVCKTAIGDAIHTIIFVRDISERKAADEALKRSEARYRSLFETSMEAILVADADDMKILDCNSAANAMFGYTKAELQEMTLYDMAPPDCRDQASQNVRKEHGTGHIYLEPVVWRKDESRFPAEVIAMTIRIGEKDRVVMSIRDVTERKKVEEALRESEEKFRLISEQSLMGLMIIQDNGLKYINQAASDIFELTVEEAMARKRLDDFSHPDDRKFIRNQIAMKQEGKDGQVTNYCYRIITNSGKQKWLELYSKTVTFKKRPADFVIMTDVSDRVSAQDELKQREEYFRSVIQNSIDGVAILGGDGKLAFVSEATEEILGYGVDEILDLNWMDLIHPDDLEKATAPLENWDHPGARIRTELRARRKDGTYRDIEISASNLLDDPGVNGIIANFRDITEQKRMRDRMERINHLFLSMGADLIYNMIKIVEAGKEIFEVPMMAYSRMEKGKFSTLSTAEGEDSLFITDQPEDFIAYKIISSKRREPWVISDVDSVQEAADDLFVLKYGYKTFAGYPVLGKKDVIGCLCIFSDEEREFSHDEIELLGTLARALSVEEERLAQEQSLKDFIDVASHELRHPITLMKGYALTLRDYGTRLNEDARQEYLTIIGQGADRLDMLIKELLDVSRIERGRFSLSKHTVRLEPLIERAVGEMRGKGCSDRFTVSIPDEMGSRTVDPEKIVRVMVVLLDNAVVHTPEKTDIDIVAQENDGAAQISVMDRGPGIADSDRDRIFERFYQVEDALHHSAPGMGLGLYIAQEIIEAHGGIIWYEPREEGGSIFRFTIP